MKKYIYFFVVGAVCLLLSATAYAEDLNNSDANIIGHVLEKSSQEHLPYNYRIFKRYDHWRDD
mgnify:CR=1 FL=1